MKHERLLAMLLLFAIGYSAGGIDESSWRLVVLLIILTLGYYTKEKMGEE